MGDPELRAALDSDFALLLTQNFSALLARISAYCLFQPALERVVVAIGK